MPCGAVICSRLWPFDSLQRVCLVLNFSPVARRRRPRRRHSRIVFYILIIFRLFTLHQHAGGEGRVVNNISIQIHSRIRSQSVFKVQRILHFVKFKFCTNPTQRLEMLDVRFLACKLNPSAETTPRRSRLANWNCFLFFPCPRPGSKGNVAVAPWHVSTRQETRQAVSQTYGIWHTATPYFNYPFEQRSHYRNRILIARKLRPRAAVTRSSSKDFRWMQHGTRWGARW